MKRTGNTDSIETAYIAMAEADKMARTAARMFANGETTIGDIKPLIDAAVLANDRYEAMQG